MNEATVYILSCIILPFLLFFFLQYGTMRLKNASLRQWLSLPIPILCGGSFLLSLYKAAVTTGWDGLGWAFLALTTGFSFAGTLLGWFFGWRKGRKEKE